MEIVRLRPVCRRGLRDRRRFDTEIAAIAAVKSYLADLEKTQPTAETGGQNGLQDHVYILRPNETRLRVRP